MTPHDRRPTPAAGRPQTDSSTDHPDAFGPETPEFWRTWERLRREHGRAAGNVFTGIWFGERRDV